MASANTPDPPNPIDILDIRRVFGNGNNQTPGDDLNDYHGVAYYETVYPYRAGKFNSTANTPLSFNDFYSKSAIDPVVPGKYEDYTAGGPRYITVPPFRNFIILDIWGAGGGGGAGDHDNVPSTASSGTASYFATKIGANSFTVTSSGGAGGTGGYRYGNQNGSGGGAGTYANTGAVTGTFKNRTNGNSGDNADAGNGAGGRGANSPYYSGLTKTYEMFLADNPSISLSTFNTVLSYYNTAIPRTFVNSGVTIKYYSLNRKPDYDGLRYWCLQYQSDVINFTKNFYYGIGTSDNQYLDYKYSRAPRPTLLDNGSSSDFIDNNITGGNGGTASTNSNGGRGGAPGAGGGGGGYSDFQSGKNANPDRAAGGGGGSGAYQRLYLTRAEITPGTKITYGVGAGGAGATGNHGNGGPGSAGGFRLFYDSHDRPEITYKKLLVSLWEYQFAGCYIGWNDLYLHISSNAFTIDGKTTGTAGGIILSVTGVAADFGVATPGYAGYWKSSGHTTAPANYYYNSSIVLNGSPFQNYTSPWWSAYKAGRDNTAFRVITNWNEPAGILTITVQGSGKGGSSISLQTINTVTPAISW